MMLLEHHAGQYTLLTAIYFGAFIIIIFIRIHVDGVLHLLFFRHDDLKEMLDSNKDSLKLEAMKRIVAVSITVCWSLLV